MGINLNNKVSPDDIAAISNNRNPSAFNDEFGDDDFGGSMGDDLFASEDDIFGSSSSGGGGFDDPFGNSGGGDPFGSSSSGDLFGSSLGGGDPFGSSGGLGSSGGFGDPFGSSGGFNSPFGAPAGGQAQAQPKEDTFDKLFNAGEEGLKNSWAVFIDIFKSVKCRNADDWALYWRTITYVGIGCAGAGVALGLIGAFGGFGLLKFSGLPLNLILCGCLSFGSSLLGIGISAFNILKINDEDSIGDISNVEPTSNNDNNSIWSNDDFDTDDPFSSNFDEDGFSDDLFDESLDELDDEKSYSAESSNDMFSSFEDANDSSDDDYDEFDPNKLINSSISTDVKDMADSIPENIPLITRKFLFETFKSFFTLNCNGFSHKSEISPESDTFKTIETLALKALGSVANKEINEMKSTLISLEETKFCYILHMTREKKLNNLPAIEKEIVSYFRDGTSDTSVNATADIDGDTYKIIITKGNKDIITFGDCFQIPEVCDFYLNEKVMLPIIAGITDFGDPLLLDAKKYDTMLIAGKPRSGKSWYLDSIIISLCAFNTPEDVQLLLIDPKESYLFKSISLLPHVCGLHNHINILDILDDVINKEGNRRKKLLLDNEVDDIWALRKKGVKLPILYIVIDEYMTIAGYLGKSEAELTKLMTTIISQLPSQGIRLLFVPHRAQGVVDKTVRTLISYIAAVRADNETVMETLGVKKWTRALNEPGDTAIKLADSPSAEFVKGVALALDDLDNTEFIKNLAKTFYKMGVDIPDMTSIGCGYNRDEEEIRERLGDGENTKHIQYNVRADLEKM